MAPGIRYHLLTLIAVFLALAIGMVIGGSYLPGAIVSGLTRQIRELNARFTEEVGPLREQNRRQADAIGALVPMVVGGRLKGMRLAIVQTGDYGDLATRLRDELTRAGARIPSLVTIPPDYRTRSQMTAERWLPALRAWHPGLPREPASPMRVLASVLASGDNGADARALEASRLIDVDGSLTHGVDGVVLVGGTGQLGESRVDAVDVPLALALRGLGVEVVLAEPETVEASSVSALSAAGASTVDNADTTLGTAALVLALQSPRGDFGARATATSGLLPAPPAAR
ncbi:MAG: copper transporter [Chthonomonadales bacterium]|nr:copper transporter [Chthonomonadales bacterium]